MRHFVVAWSWFDIEHEESHVIYRAVVDAKQRVLAEVEAKSLIPQVIFRHNIITKWPADLVPEDIEVSVKPLDEWLNSMKNNAEMLRTVNIHPEEED
jgi:hypothetical protein